MSAYTEEWLNSLLVQQGLSEHTISAYRQDLETLHAFTDQNKSPLDTLDEDDLLLFSIF